ncbi:MAG: hypothetical protein C5B50_19530 [Verrucomicrobia bacterium]|nr:MAG: hypothetical protein C5B50_19530 [Verrucomicrobiota bacterium]
MLAAPTGASSTQAEPVGFIDEREALKRVPVSRRTWHDWRKKKGLPHIRVGGRILYHWDSVTAWLLRQQRGA